MKQAPQREREPQDELVIRAARVRDLPFLTRLIGQLGYSEPESAVRARFARIRADRKDHRLFVAVLRYRPPQADPSAPGRPPGAAVAGWIHIYADKILVVGPRAQVGGLVVDKRFRGRGVGKALVQRAERWATRRGCTAVVIHTNVTRTQAHAFYERCGYSLLKQQRVYHKPLAPA